MASAVSYQPLIDALGLDGARAAIVRPVGTAGLFGMTAPVAKVRLMPPAALVSTSVLTPSSAKARTAMVAAWAE